MKKFIAALAAALMALATFTFTSCSEEKADFTVGVVQLVEHSALDKNNNGFTDKLNELMAAAGKKVEILKKVASGVQSDCKTITDNFVAKKVDLIMAIATPAAQAASSSTETIPILFSAVTNAVTAGLVVSNEAPGKNISGTSDINPVARQIDLITELVPGIKKIGFLYTTSEINSVYQLQLAKAECEKLNVSLAECGISDINDLQTEMTAIAGSDIEAIYIPTDNPVAKGIETVNSYNLDGKKLPIVCGESSANDKCGVATYSVDYETLGAMTAQMAFDILVNGKNVSEMPVESQLDSVKLVINQTKADELGFTIPQSVLEKLSA